MALVIMVKVKGVDAQSNQHEFSIWHLNTHALGKMALQDEGMLHRYHSSLLTCGMFDLLTAYTVSQDATSGSGRTPTVWLIHTRDKEGCRQVGKNE